MARSGKGEKDYTREDFLAEYRDSNQNPYERSRISRTERNLNKGKNNSNKKEKLPKKKKKKTLRKILVVILLLAILTAGIFIAVSYKFIDSQVKKFNKIDTDNIDLYIDNKVADNLKDYENIALFGLDSRDWEDKSKARTDAMMILSINKNNGQVRVISLLRDTYMFMSNSEGFEFFDKANHAHHFGGAINTVRMINRNMDLNINKFMVLDWKAVVDLVDNMGGIDIDVKEAEIEDLNLAGPETASNTGKEWIDVTDAGIQNLNGVQVASYCRIRNTSGGDIGRTSRMRKVILSILSKAKSDPKKMMDVASNVFPQIDTNLDTSDIISLGFKMINFKIDKSIGYPTEFYGGLVGEVWQAIPTTMESNIKILYKEAFDIEDYRISNQAKEINDLIINSTGISIPNDENKLDPEFQ